MVKTPYSREEVLSFISDIPDPEIPVITIKELGILRDVEITPEGYLVSITPTYMGCPAMKMIQDQIRETMTARGITEVKIQLVYAPAWTTDWMSAEAKEKLRALGIAPPGKSGSPESAAEQFRQVKCPRCHSSNTSLISQFGSTACKAFYRCLDCKEPFDYFKCI